MIPRKSGLYWARDRKLFHKKSWSVVYYDGQDAVYEHGHHDPMSVDRYEFHPYAGEIRQPD